jgi:hypothetical protein
MSETALGILTIGAVAVIALLRGKDIWGKVGPDGSLEGSAVTTPVVPSPVGRTIPSRQLRTTEPQKGK